MFETFEHTADLGIRVRAETLKELFEEAAAALFAVIVDNPQDICPNQPFSFHIEGTRTDELFLDWLNELLYLFATSHIVLAKFDVNPQHDGLTATAWGEPYNAATHRIGEEIKAITYHGLKVEKLGGQWLAEVIVDI